MELEALNVMTRFLRIVFLGFVCILLPLVLIVGGAVALARYSYTDWWHYSIFFYSLAGLLLLLAILYMFIRIFFED